ncbi:MAG: SGNH/GDSL hydrolase family protein [Planctomycetaceae bacterium]
MPIRLITLLFVSFVSAVPVLSFWFQDAPQESRWEADIRKLEQALVEHPQEPGGIVFVGSSSIRRWDLKKSFPELSAVNHGFGGSEMSDAVRFFDRIVTPLKPATVVLYEGDNDIGKGKSPEQVHADFQQFVRLFREKLSPDSRLAFIAIKPSLKRWHLAEPIQKANQLVAADCLVDDRLTYIDVWAPMLGEDEKPRPELFVSDGLHLSEAGYQVWADVVRPALQPRPVSAQ